MDKNKKLFPQRLWELIHDEKYNFCLRWSPNGQRVYLNRTDFENHYLKTPNNQFHTQKAISFVRQMNMYGFRKVDDCYYENDNFKRNCHRLLKNMVRRHSNKPFYTNNSQSQSNNSHNNNQITNSNHHNSYNTQHRSNHLTSIPQPLCLYPRNQTYQQQQQNHPEQSDRATISRATFVDIERQTTMAAAAAAAAQCIRDAGGSVGNIGAALASLNTTNPTAVKQPTTSRSPMASTLYHRLAALNFDHSNRTNEQFLQHRQQHACPSASPGELAAPIAASLFQENIGNSNLNLIDKEFTDRILSQRVNPSDQQPNLAPKIQVHDFRQQSSMATHQAAQQNLVRSFLQLKQPEVPLALQQNLLASLHQHNPNLLLESLVSLSTINHQLAQTNQLASTGINTSPLGLVADALPTVTDRLNSVFQQNTSAILDINDSLINLPKPSTINVARSGIGGYNGTSPLCHNRIDDENEFEQDDDEFALNLGNQIFNGGNQERGDISSASYNQESSRHYGQDFEDMGSAVLNLAKPSNKNALGNDD